MIIGLGNEMRGDDGAGLRVVDLLTGRGFDAIRFDGEPISLLDLWPGSDRVLVIDAVSGSRPGRISRLLPSADDLPVVLAPGSSHLVGLAEVIELGSQLDLLPARLELIGIEGTEFALGRPLSAAVEAACETVAATIIAELESAGPSGAAAGVGVGARAVPR
jgi:hydrogenase maturation protease